MKITKFEHACLIVEDSGRKIVIDPGNYTRPADSAHGFDARLVDAIVLTHLHDDHCFAEQIDRILEVSPGVPIYAPAGVVKKLAGYSVTEVEPGQTVDVATSGTPTEFALEFFGGKHAIIHPSIPQIDNVGVFVNNRLYYPGDSFVAPGRPVDVLAVPSSAPWLKAAEFMDFVAEVKPRHSFPTHNALWSDFGQVLANSRIDFVTREHGGAFTYLLPGESLDI